MSGAVLILAGPTCSGKTELALALAERYDAEIVGADSRQIYRGMPIGTAAPGAAALARVPHHLIGFLDPYERYSAARFASDALAAIAQIHARGKRALVAGGTGFYIRALAGDVALCAAYDPALRERLVREARLHPPEVLYEWLASRAPARAAALAAGDTYRVVRALEIALVTEPGANGARAHPSLRSAGIPFVKLVLDVAQEELDRRIGARVEAMLAAGLVDEAERIGPRAVAADAVGYPQALAYLRGWLGEGDLTALLFRATRRYAKRQRTWFRSEPGVRFVTADTVADAARELAGWA
ncbi:MAG: tRNA (adenosine(37)-N6)-dimethylallyltransferase MiaA [Candidatus Baltobacteraceae bacterium]